MIRTEIFVENTRVDLLRDISAEFTYAIDDIQDFAARNTSFSKTIVLPGNAVNNKLFGHIFEFGSANFYDADLPNIGYNFNAAKAASCVVYVDNIQIFKGVLRLLEIVLDNGTIEYECAVFGELGGFVSALGNDRLEDLDFSAYDHEWTLANIQNSWNSVSGTGYYYPLIDYGKVSYNSKHDWDVKAFRPALYVREYIDKIITGAGYTYEAPFFNTSLFRRLIVPNNQKKFATLKEYNLQRRNSSYIFTEADGTTKAFPLPISEITQDFTSDATSTAFTYTGANMSGRYVLNIRGFWQKNSSIPFHFDVQINGTTVASHSWESSTSPTPNLFNLITEGPITINTNDVLSFRFRQDIATDFELTVQMGQGLVQIKPATPVEVDMVLGNRVFLNLTSVPRGIYQRDFFASVIKMFNLYVVEDVNKGKHLVIKPYIDFYDNGFSLLNTDDYQSELLVDDDDFLLLSDGSISYVDWSQKVDRSKPVRLRPMSELNGRYFEYKYKADNDYYNEQYQKKYSQGYGDRIEDSGFEFAKEKQTAEILFAATPLVGYGGEDKVFPTIFKLTGVGTVNQTEDQTDHVVRILQAKKLSGLTAFAIKNGSATTLATVTTYGYGGHLDDPDDPSADLNFGAPKEIYFTLTSTYPEANLFNGFWSDYVAEITDKDSKVMTCNVLLKETDIYSLDFAKLIYIDGSLWRLNKVENYNPMNYDTTKCEFLKVIQLTYE